MTILWKAHELVRATGGNTIGDWAVHGISIDSRETEKGDLFVALTDQRDGHDFVAAAFAAGARAAMVSRVPEGLPQGAPLLVVDDVLAALEDIARAGRRRMKGQIVAITGSAGKTSTKDMLRRVLSHQGKCHAAERSFNNHWGVPLTLARMPADADFGVIEIGMNHPGEIAPLSQLAKPDVAIVTNVAPAHLAAFKDVAAIAEEKASILKGLKKGGTAILNADLDTSPILIRAAKRRNCTLHLFGESWGTDTRLEKLTLGGQTTVAELRHHRKPYLLKLRTPGGHFALNALAVLAATEALGCDLVTAIHDLGKWAPPDGRGTVETIVLDIVEDDMVIDLIDDAFNANPASMEAALEVLAASQPKDGTGAIAKGRRIAVLGDMLELGPDEAAMHAALARLPAMRKIDRVHCVGPLMSNLYSALPATKRGRRFDDAESAAAAAHGFADAGDVVLVKGSKGSRVSLVVDAVRKLGHPAVRDEQGD